MKKAWFHPSLLVISVLIVSSFLTGQGQASPCLEGPSGLIMIPDTTVGSAVSCMEMAGFKVWTYNQMIGQGFLEIGMRKNEMCETNSFNVKALMLSEGAYFPSLAIGAWDISNDTKDLTKFFVLSKSLDSFGLNFIFGRLTKGQVKDVKALRNFAGAALPAPGFNSSEKEYFYGVEISLIPLVSFMAEKVDDRVNYGVRFRPVPRLTVDWDFLDVKKRYVLNDRKILNFSYTVGF